MERKAYRHETVHQSVPPESLKVYSQGTTWRPENADIHNVTPQVAAFQSFCYNVIRCDRYMLIRFLLISLWLGCLTGAVAQESAARLTPPGEVICGYARSYSAIESSRVKQGLCVQLLAGEAVVSQPVPLRFRVCQLPQGAPADDLQVEHEKLMHVIGVREDLGDFVHIHPLRTAPGMWEIIHVFTNAGRYQFWSDIKYRGTVYSFAHPRFTVAGELKTAPRGPIPQLEDRKAGYHVTLNPSKSRLIAGNTNLFDVIVRDKSGNQVGTEFFLGSLMHFVIVSSDLSVYRHAHAKEHWKSGRTVSFELIFPQPGLYKIFAQFRPQKTKLPKGEAILAEFWVKVSSR